MTDPLEDLFDQPKPRSTQRGLTPELQTHWNNLKTELESAGVRPVVRSGFRTAEQQNALHRAGKPTKGNDGYIKISPHQEGRALDLGNLGGKGQRIVRDYARRTGLHVPSDEPWHIAVPKGVSQQQANDPLSDLFDAPQQPTAPPVSQPRGRFSAMADAPRTQPSRRRQQPGQVESSGLGAPPVSIADVRQRDNEAIQRISQAERVTFEDLKRKQERLKLQYPGAEAANIRHQIKSDDELKRRAAQIVSAQVDLEADRPQIDAVKAKLREFVPDDVVIPVPASTGRLNVGRMVEGAQSAIANSGVQAGNLISGLTGFQRGQGLTKEMRIAQQALAELDAEDPDKGWQAAAERGLPAAAIELAKMTTLSRVPVVGRATLPGLGALSEADQGSEAAAKGAVVGELYHRGFGAMRNLPKPVQFAAGTAVPTGIAVAEGADPKRALLENTAFGAMALAGGRKPPTLSRRPMPEVATREAAPPLRPSELQQRTELRVRGEVRDTGARTRTATPEVAGTVPSVDVTVPPVGIETPIGRQPAGAPTERGTGRSSEVGHEGVTNAPPTKAAPQTPFTVRDARGVVREVDDAGLRRIMGETPEGQSINIEGRQGIRYRWTKPKEGQDAQTETQPEVSARVEGEKPNQPQARSGVAEPAERNRVVSELVSEPQAVEPVTPHYERQNRRARNTQGGAKGQFKRGFKEEVAAPEPPSGVPAKAPWEMTRAEYVTDRRAALAKEAGKYNASLLGSSKGERFGQEAALNHRARVEKAIRKGKSVPAEVLQDYPDLAPPSVVGSALSLREQSRTARIDEFWKSQPKLTADMSKAEWDQATAARKEDFSKFYGELIEEARSEQEREQYADKETIRSVLEGGDLKKYSWKDLIKIDHTLTKVAKTLYDSSVDLSTRRIHNEDAIKEARRVFDKSMEVADLANRHPDTAHVRKEIAEGGGEIDWHGIAANNAIVRRGLEYLTKISESPEDRFTLAKPVATPSIVGEGKALRPEVFPPRPKGPFTQATARQENEDIAQAKYGKPFADLDQPQRADVVRTKMRMSMAGGEAAPQPPEAAALPLASTKLAPAAEGGQKQVESDGLLPLPAKYPEGVSSDSAKADHLAQQHPQQVNSTRDFQELSNRYYDKVSKAPTEPATPPPTAVKPASSPVKEGAARVATSSPARETKRQDVKPSDIQVGDYVRTQSTRQEASISGEVVSIGRTNVKIRAYYNPGGLAKAVEQIHTIPKSSIAETKRSAATPPQSVPPIKPEPSTTSAKKAQMSGDREALDLPTLTPAQRKSWRESLSQAKPESANRLADEVLSKPRALNDAETASVVVRAQQVKNEHAAKMAEISAATDAETIQNLRGETQALEAEFDKLTQATKASGTEKGRTLAAQKLTINQDFDLVSVKARLKAAKGRPLTEKEDTRVEQMVKERDQAIKERDAAIEKARINQIQNEITKVQRQRRRAETKEALDQEAAVIKQNIAAEFARLKSQQGQTLSQGGLGNLDPEGVITRNLVKYARNRVRANVGLRAEALLDDATALIQEFDKGITRQQVADLLSGYKLSAPEPRAEDVRRLAEIRAEIRKIRAQEDIAAGIRTERTQGPRKSDIRKLPMQGPSRRLFSRNQQRMKQLEKQEVELARRLEERDFSKPEKAEPLPYTREVQRAQERVTKIDSQFKAEADRADPWHWLREASSIRKSGMLSGFITHVRNIGGTAAFQGFEETRRIPSVLADAAASTVTGRRTVTLSPSAALDGVIQAMTVGRREAGEILRVGATREQMERQQLREINTGVKAIDLAFNSVFRVMSASDRVFYNQAYKRNLVERAQAQAITERRTDKTVNVRGRTKEIVDSVSTEMDADAKHDALVATFNNNNYLSTKITQLRSGSGGKNAVGNFALDLVLPFDRTPTNVLMRVIEASPAGYAKNAGQIAKGLWRREFSAKEQRAFSETFGRATTGTAIIALGVALAAKGLLETDEYGRTYLKAGGRTINLSAVSPIGTLLGTGAAIHREYAKPNPSKRGYAGAVIKPLADQPILKASSQVSDLIQDPQRNATKFGANTAFSFVPFSGAVRTVAQATDPEERRYPQTFGERVKMNIPGLRETVPVSPSPLFRLNTSTEATKELKRLDYTPRGATKSEKESDEDFEKRKAVVNRNIVTQIDSLIKLREYQQADDKQKREMIGRIPSQVGDAYQRTQPRKAHERALPRLRINLEP